MRTSDAGLALIREHEGCKLTAYLCPAGVWTIGVGHTGPDVTAGLQIDQQEADRLLRNDLTESEQCVEWHVTVELKQHQFDALVSLVFNIGCGAFEKSTILRLLNEGKMDAAAAQFARWDKADGRVLAGLTKRREAERALFTAAA